MNNFENLYNNIVDMIKEAQIKVGYSDNSFGIFYPLESLNSILENDQDANEMEETLKEFADFAKDRLGAIDISAVDERFSFTIPKEGTKYVHENVKDSDFLKDFIETVLTRGCTIEDIKSVFHKYSDKVIFKEMDDEFEYLLYFADGQPDEYRYCIEFEMGMATYHRFRRDEYLAFGFEE